MPDDRLKVALGQMRVGPRAEDNLRRCVALMRRAASEGARLIVLPEGVIARDPADPALCARRAERLDGPFVEGLLEASRGIPVAVACTVHVLPRDAGGKVSNVHLVAQGGKLLAAYRKLHLYDAFASRESDTVEAGREVPPLVEIDGWRLGLAASSASGCATTIPATGRRCTAKCLISTTMRSRPARMRRFCPEVACGPLQKAVSRYDVSPLCRLERMLDIWTYKLS